jgi:hypothetical protein
VTETSGNRAGKWFKYAAFGEVQEASECAAGEVHSTQYEYDALGRQSVMRYPQVAGSRLALKYHYTPLGFLKYVSDEANRPYWVVTEMNAAGQVTKEYTRNGVETQPFQPGFRVPRGRLPSGNRPRRAEST